MPASLHPLPPPTEPEGSEHGEWRLAGRRAEEAGTEAFPVPRGRDPTGTHLPFTRTRHGRSSGATGVAHFGSRRRLHYRRCRCWRAAAARCFGEGAGGANLQESRTRRRPRRRGRPVRCNPRKDPVCADSDKAAAKDSVPRQRPGRARGPHAVRLESPLESRLDGVRRAGRGAIRVDCGIGLAARRRRRRRGSHGRSRRAHGAGTVATSALEDARASLQ